MSQRRPQRDDDKEKIEREFSKKENWGSRHRCLFKENIGKTKKDKEWQWNGEGGKVIGDATSRRR